LRHRYRESRWLPSRTRRLLTPRGAQSPWPRIFLPPCPRCDRRLRLSWTPTTSGVQRCRLARSPRRLSSTTIRIPRPLFLYLRRVRGRFLTRICPRPGELPSQPRTRRLHMLLSEESVLLLELLVGQTTLCMTPNFVNCATYSRSKVTYGR
jgi:hypothetical protein